MMFLYRAPRVYMWRRSPLKSCLVQRTAWCASLKASGPAMKSIPSLRFVIVAFCSPFARAWAETGPMAKMESKLTTTAMMIHDCVMFSSFEHIILLPISALTQMYNIRYRKRKNIFILSIIVYILADYSNMHTFSTGALFRL
jgi:hypothetical protein